MAEDKNLQKKLAKFAEEIMNIARSECSTIEEETQSDLETQRASLKAAADAEAAKYFEAELREIDYAAFLNAKAAEAAAQGDFAGGTLYLRQEDLSYADALTKVLPGCTAAASPEIHLGGLIAVSADGRTRLDLSLDAALEGQKQWFFSNSKLDITL